ncbi:MAG TPA: hypothetical protein VFA10_11355, partial [Ktedonobacteraceae bacterium]|nr:hypothetical protein [Ktedonobacteraceae bacterium]
KVFSVPRLALGSFTSLLYHKHLTTIVHVLVSPFETSALSKSLLELKWGKEVLTEHRYRVVVLWLQDARELVEQGQVELYALLPTMRGQRMSCWHRHSGTCGHFMPMKVGCADI